MQKRALERQRRGRTELPSLCSQELNAVLTGKTEAQVFAAVVSCFLQELSPGSHRQSQTEAVTPRKATRI